MSLSFRATSAAEITGAADEARSGSGAALTPPEPRPRSMNCTAAGLHRRAGHDALSRAAPGALQPWRRGRGRKPPSGWRAAAARGDKKTRLPNRWRPSSARIAGPVRPICWRRRRPRTARAGRHVRAHDRIRRIPAAHRVQRGHADPNTSPAGRRWCAQRAASGVRGVDGAFLPIAGQKSKPAAEEARRPSPPSDDATTICSIESCWLRRDRCSRTLTAAR